MRDIFMYRSFRDQRHLLHPHIPHIPFHETGHTRHSLLVAALPVITHPVQVKEEADHEITAEHHVTGILDIVITGGTGDALVLVQDIIDRKLDLPVLLFEDLLAETCIPQRHVQVIPFSTAGVQIVVKVG